MRVQHEIHTEVKEGIAITPVGPAIVREETICVHTVTIVPLAELLDEPEDED